MGEFYLDRVVPSTDQTVVRSIRTTEDKIVPHRPANRVNKMFISRARPTLNLPCISPQNSVTCNGEYRRPFIKAQPSFHDVEVDGGYVEYLSK